MFINKNFILRTAPEVSLVPSGNVEVMDGGSFIFNCSVTFKIPPLPIEILINGTVQNGSDIIQTGTTINTHPLYTQEFILTSVSLNDNLTAIQCQTLFNTATGVLTVTSLPAVLFVAGGLNYIKVHLCKFLCFYGVYTS